MDSVSDVREQAAPPAPPVRGSRLPAARAGAVIVLGMVALAVPLGLLWAAVSPRVGVMVTPRGPDLVDAETKAFIGADALFLLLAAAAGASCGLAAWALGRRHGPVVPVALAVGGVLAALLAWRTGHQVGLAQFRRALAGPPTGRVVRAAVDVRAKGVLVAWAVAALVPYSLLLAYVPADSAGIGDGGGRGDLGPAAEPAPAELPRG